MPGLKLDLALLLFPGSFPILHFLPAVRGSLWPAPRLGLVILFTCAFSRCLTINRLELPNEARYKCRHELQLQPQEPRTIHSMGHPVFLNFAPLLFTRPGHGGVEKGYTISCLQNSQSGGARGPIGTTQCNPLILQLKKQDPKVK